MKSSYIKINKRSTPTKRKRRLQLELVKDEGSRYGGSLLNTRKGRSRGRPLSTSNTMHLVMRSEMAKGQMSFCNYKKEIKVIIDKFSKKYHIRIYSYANVGNHLHLHIKLSNRQQYKAFIRAISSAIMMKVTGMNRWAKESVKEKLSGKRFWTLRPYSRVLKSFKERLSLKDYIEINKLEGFGYNKNQARFIFYREKWAGSS